MGAGCQNPFLIAGLLCVRCGNTSHQQKDCCASAAEPIYRCANTEHHRLNYEKFCFNIRIKANLAKMQVKLYYNQPHTVAWSITVLLIATTATSDDKVWRDEQNSLRCLECKMSKSLLSAENTVHQEQKQCSLAVGKLWVSRDNNCIKSRNMKNSTST